MSSGEVFVAGGENALGTTLITTFIVDPTTVPWTIAQGPNLNFAREGHTQVRPDARWLAGCNGYERPAVGNALHASPGIRSALVEPHLYISAVAELPFGAVRLAATDRRAKAGL